MIASNQETNSRFRLYESIREFAAHKLPPEQLVALQERFAQHYIDKSQVWAAAIGRRNGLSASNALAAEMDNLCAVYAQRMAAGQAQQATRALLNLDPIFQSRGPITVYLELLADIPNDIEATLRGRILEARGRALRVAGQIASSRSTLLEALTVVEASDELGLVGRINTTLGLLDFGEGQLDGAAALLERAIAQCTKANDGSGLARALNARASVANRQGAIELASNYFAEAYKVACHSGDRQVEGMVLGNWAYLNLRCGQGDPVEEFRRALAIAEELGYERGIAHLRGRIGAALHDGGELVQAAAYCLESAEWMGRIGYRTFEGDALANLGAICHEMSDTEKAKSYYDQALEIFLETGAHRSHTSCLAMRSGLLASQDKLEKATAMLETARTNLVSGGDESLVLLIEIQAGQLALAEARRAASEGHPKQASDLRLVARQCLALAAKDSAPPPNEEARAAGRLLEMQLRADDDEIAIGEELVVGIACQWFRVGDGDKVDLRKREPMRRVFAALVEERTLRPGHDVTAAVLIAAAWPDNDDDNDNDERGPRLRTTLARLRKLGLHDCLSKGKSGWHLREAVPVRHVAQ